MDKIQKIGTWIWYNKERMLLLVMVLVLVYRVYQVLNPPPPEVYPRLPQPRLELPDELEERQALGLPGNPPTRPPLAMPGVYVAFFERNPFWYHSGSARTDSSQEARSEDLNIQLLNIQDAGGRPSAQLRTIRTTSWYREGAQFEEFELQSIDTETETVVVYSERHSRSFTLRRQ